ncbi:MAG: WD40 repeat domain-containing protein [Anaerolineaceae bacterium]
MTKITIPSIFILLSLLSSACAAQTPALSSQPPTAATSETLVLETINASSAKRITQIFPKPGESGNLSPAWVYGWDGLIMMEDRFYFDAANALHWTSTLPEALDYACHWDTLSDPACQMTASAPEKIGGLYSLLTVAGAGDLYSGVVEGRKFSLFAGTQVSAQPLLTAELPEGARVLNLTYYPEIKTAALHVRLSDPVKDALLVVGDSAGRPYEIGFCRTFNASTDPAKTLNDLICLISRDGKYQLGRGNLPEVIETAGGKRVSLLPPEILTGYPDLNSLLVWPDGKTVSYVNQTLNVAGEISAIDLLKFDLQKRELAATVPLPLPAEELNQLKTDYALSPDGSLLAVATLGNNIFLVDSTSGEALMVLRFKSPATRLAFSPDGKLLAAGFYNRQIVLFGVPGE